MLQLKQKGEIMNGDNSIETNRENERLQDGTVCVRERHQGSYL